MIVKKTHSVTNITLFLVHLNDETICDTVREEVFANFQNHSWATFEIYIYQTKQLKVVSTANNSIFCSCYAFSRDHWCKHDLRYHLKNPEVVRLIKQNTPLAMTKKKAGKVKKSMRALQKQRDVPLLTSTLMVPSEEVVI